MITTASHKQKLKALEAAMLIADPTTQKLLWTFCTSIYQERLNSPCLSQESAAKLDHFYKIMCEDGK